MRCQYIYLSIDRLGPWRDPRAGDPFSPRVPRLFLSFQYYRLTKLTLWEWRLGTPCEKGPPGSLHGPSWSIFWDRCLDNRQIYIYSLVVNPTDSSKEKLFCFLMPPKILQICTPDTDPISNTKFLWKYCFNDLVRNYLEPHFK